MKERKCFEGYEKIELLRKQERVKRLMYRVLYDKWYFVLKFLRGCINDKDVKRELDTGFLSDGFFDKW